MNALVNYYYHAFTLIEPKVKLPPAAPGAFAMVRLASDSSDTTRRP